jgi:hypothetical protein
MANTFFRRFTWLTVWLFLAGPGVYKAQPLLPELKVKEVVAYASRDFYKLVDSPELYVEKWDTLPEVRFWREVMTTGVDSCIINTARRRHILAKIATWEWNSLSWRQRRTYLRTLRRRHGVHGGIYVTEGMKSYYRLREVLPQLGEAIDIFLAEGVDPWYAQAILSIESPGQIARSPAGAYGPFQLMRNVATSYGLKVNRHVDERAEIDKSALAAAQLIRRVCIPEARMLLARHRIRAAEGELWFRLLVLHIYHAGSANVGAALRQIRPRQGGQALLTRLWQAHTRDFRNASRNYSQLALAAQTVIEQIATYECYPLCAPEEYDYLQLLSTNGFTRNSSFR